MKEIDKIKARIIEVKEKKLRIQRLYDFVSQHDDESHRPSQSDVEIWYKYDRYGAMEAWEKQGGGLTWKKNKNGEYYFDKEAARKEYQEFDEFCKEFVRHMMTRADWLHFYTVLNNMYKHSLDGLYLQVEKMEHEASFKRSTKPGESKFERVLKFSEDFVEMLRNGKFSTSEEVISALKDIEEGFDPIGDIEINLLDSWGKPIEIRICRALAHIFSLKYDGEEINESHIQKEYEKIGMKIGYDK